MTQKTGRKIDFSILNEVFGDLKVLRLCDERYGASRATLWECQCLICGGLHRVPRFNLESGNTSSCGCRKGASREVARRAKVSENVVGKVLRGKWRSDHRVSEAAAERVKRVAAELNYQPWYRVRS